MSAKISVCILSYNHANYMAQAIEGVLMQETEYDYEIIISDDCSTDGTRAILLEYQSKYPDKIVLLFPQYNLGMMNNFIHLLNNAHGEYIALCEGDDYWVDKKKLQTQVSFLENNRDFSMSFHRVYEQTGSVKEISADNPWEDELTLDIYQITNGNFMHTNSVVYRNKLFSSFPSWYAKSPIGDYILHLLNARYGLIKYFPEIMGVYRKMSGIWSTQSKALQINKVVKALDYLSKEEFPVKVLSALSDYRDKLFNQYCLMLLDENDLSFVADMNDLLSKESDFVKKWMLSYYPDKISQILNSRTYKLSKLLSNFKQKLSL